MSPIDLVIWALAVAVSVVVVGGASYFVIYMVRVALGRVQPLEPSKDDER